jgi:hypothetical protein
MNLYDEDIREDQRQEREDMSPLTRCALCEVKYPDITLCPLCHRCDGCCRGHTIVDSMELMEMREVESIEVEREMLYDRERAYDR